MKLKALKPIARLLTREFLGTALLMAGVSLVVFAVLYLSPGNPFRQLVQPGVINAEAGAPPWYTQYLAWLGQVLQGDLGNSTRTGQPVLREVIRTGINTLYLTVGAMLLTLLIALPIAIFSARKGRSATSWGLSAFCYVASALPAFWFGYIVIYIAIHRFGFFPLAFGSQPQQHRLLFYLLPILVLGLCSGALSEVVRYLREEISRVMAEEYIRTARAKGAPAWKHAFKEAFLLPISEIMAAKIPFLLGGAVVVEQVFNWPGMGRMAWQAAQDRDFPLIMGITLMAALVVRMGSFIKQTVHIAVNPRASQV